MGPEISREETEWRRRLLFRLLIGFDFDHPTIPKKEEITEPIGSMNGTISADEFLFSFGPGQHFWDT